MNRLKINSLSLVCLIVMATATLTAQKNQEPIKVFVFTAANDSGFVDADLQRRNDSVKDLKGALSKNPIIQIVSERDGADVTLEVLGRGGEETGSATTSRGIDGQWHTNPDTVATVRVDLRAGAYSTIFEGMNNGRIVAVWRQAANNAAKGVENWIKANHDSLLSRRSDVQSASPKTIDGIGACVPGSPTPACRVAASKIAEFGLQRSAPDASISLGGAPNEVMVITSRTLFDKPEGRIAFRDKGSKNGMEKQLCAFGFKRIVLVGSSSLPNDRYEYDLICTTNQ